jgi:hypothetical protein
MKAPPQESSMWSTLRVPDILVECSEKDVFCGRAKQSLSNPGNRRYRAVIEQYREQYQQSSRRAEKSRLTQAVIKVIRDQDSRFLKPTGGRSSSSTGWVELTEDEVYEKVSHALRCTKDPRDAVLCHARSTQPVVNPRPHFARQASDQDPASAATISTLVEDDFRRVSARQRAIFRDLIASRRQHLADYSDEAYLHAGLRSEAAHGTGTFDEVLEGASDGSDIEVEFHGEPYGLDEVFPSTHAQL